MNRESLRFEMRIMYGGGYSEEDRLQQRPSIYSTVLNGMKEVLRCLKEFHIPFQNPENEQNCSKFEDWRDWSGRGITTDASFSSYVEPLMSLWRDQGVQEAANRAGLYTLKESFHYLMSNMDTVGQLGYIPSTQDIFRCQSLAIGINELVVDVSDTLTYRFISIGGSRIRSSGRRWMHVFDDAACVLFFVAANEFDQTIPEDDTTNRLGERLALFEVVSNYPWFKSVPIILILSKCDLLAEKIKVKNIRDYFSNFEGDPHSLDDVQKFLVEMFDTVRPDSSSRGLLSYFMTSIDTENVRGMFAKVQDAIIATYLILRGII